MIKKISRRKKIILEANTKKYTANKFIQQILSCLKRKNCEVLLSPETKNPEDIISADYVFSLGGDGTFLRTARKYSQYNKPILGINFGHLGYLTSAEKTNIDYAINKLLSGQYFIEKRSMLKIKGSRNVALNDICIGRKSFEAKLISFDLYINNNLVDTYKADGFIISTPTGSTAYNLSAGGPIIKPTLPVFVLTPVCPHTLYSRPIIISQRDEIKIVVQSNLANTRIIIDGQRIIPSQKNIYVTCADFQTQIIKIDQLNFYDVLRKKLVDKSS